MRPNKNDFACLLLILPPLFWAGNVVLARGVVDLIPPVAMSFWRWTIALAILLPFAWRRLSSDLPVIMANWKIITLLGLLGIASFNTLLYTAAHTTSSINIALTQSVMPAVIVMISYVLFKDRINIWQCLAVCICMLGAANIVMRGNLQHLLQLEFVTGDLLMLLAVFLYALYSVLLRKRPQLHQLSFLAATFAVGVIFLAPLYLWELQYSPSLQVNRSVIASLLYVGVFPSVFSYLFWNRGVELVGANRAGLFINLIPLFASFMAVFFLDETVHGYHLAGLALIFSGLGLFNAPFHQAAKPNI